MRILLKRIRRSLFGFFEQDRPRFSREVKTAADNDAGKVMVVRIGNRLVNGLAQRAADLRIKVEFGFLLQHFGVKGTRAIRG